MNYYYFFFEDGGKEIVFFLLNLSERAWFELRIIIFSKVLCALVIDVRQYELLIVSFLLCWSLFQGQVVYLLAVNALMQPKILASKLNKWKNKNILFHIGFSCIYYSIISWAGCFDLTRMFLGIESCVT